jgi:membrane-bound inhibitor of C-type lysozyme
MTSHRALALGVLATVLAGCSAAEMPGSGQAVRITYECDAGKGFVADFQRGAQHVDVQADSGTLKLDQVPSLSGDYRYSDGSSTLQAHNRWAVLETPGAEYTNCIPQNWEESVPGIVEGTPPMEEGTPMEEDVNQTPMGETPAPTQ